MLRPSPLDRQVLAFDVTKFAEPFSKGLVERRNAGRRTGRQKTHTHAFPGRLRTTLLLRLDGERHGEQVRDKGEGEDQRRSPPHGLLPAGLTTYPCCEPVNGDARRSSGAEREPLGLSPRVRGRPSWRTGRLGAGAVSRPASLQRSDVVGYTYNLRTSGGLGYGTNGRAAREVDTFVRRRSEAFPRKDREATPRLSRHLLEEIVQEKLNPYGHTDLKDSVAYVRLLRRRSRRTSDERSEEHTSELQSPYDL